MKPEVPSLLVWNGMTTDVEYKPGKPMITTLLGAVTYSRKKNHLVLYDSAGQKWRCCGVSLASGRVTWLHRIASLCFINPCRPCVLEWGDPTGYEFSEIVEIVRKEISEDDDIVTQWHSKEKCIDTVTRAKNVKELLAAMRRLRK